MKKLLVGFVVMTSLICTVCGSSANKSQMDDYELIRTLSAATQENEANTSMTLEAVQNVTEVVTELQHSSEGLREIAKDISENVKTFKLS